MMTDFEKALQSEAAEKYFMDANNRENISSNVKDAENMAIQRFADIFHAEIPSENIVCKNIVIHDKIGRSKYKVDLIFSGLNQDFTASELDYLINDYVLSFDAIPVTVTQEIASVPFNTCWKIGVDLYNIQFSSSDDTYATFSATMALDIMENMSSGKDSPENA